MKKILSLILALVMVFSVCSFATAETTEPVHLIWFMYISNQAPIDWPEVEEALNAYSAEKIGVTCEFRYMDETQVALATQTGEYFDIAFTCDWWNDYATNVAAGMFLQLDDYLDQFPALKESVLDLAWEGVKINGNIYAIPHMKDIGYEIFWILNSDFFLNECGFEKDSYITFEGIEKYFEAFKEKYPDDYPFKMSKGGITSWQNALADWLSLDYEIGLDWDAQGTENEHQVLSALEIPRWVNRVKKIHEWYQKGYINPDAAVTESMPRKQAGVVQSGQGWFGAETVWANAIQKPVYISRYDGAYLSTSSIRGSMTAVSSFSEHPMEALKLIELMNTDPWYRETARYGIEGKHYTRNEDGTISHTELGSVNMALQAYAQGHYTLGALEASPFPEVPTDIHQWEKTMAGYADATLSAAMGFTPDLAPVETECLAIKQILEEYKPELFTGTSDPDVVIPEMLSRMKDAGLETVKAEIQSQLDAFLAK